MLPERLNYDSSTCSIGAALDLVGEKWSLLILREAFFGSRRFDDILQAVGCARSMLTARFASLVDNGIMRRVAYREAGARARYEYVLTDKGRDIFPILVALLQWGDRWNAPMGKPAVILRHAGCKAEVRAELTCMQGHRKLHSDEIYARPGLGAIRPK